MSPWEKVLDRPAPRGHFLQLCDLGGDSLSKNVSRYLWEGLKRGDGLLVIATAENSDAFCKELAKLGADVAGATQSGQLAIFDAQETLRRFMVGGQPDWDLFGTVVGTAMRKVRPQRGQDGLCAYGEMVGVLWKARQFSAAIRLEQFWNKLLGRSSFTLFCGYAMDVFGADFKSSALDALLSAHTHLLPSDANGNLETAVTQAITEVLGPEAENLTHLLTDYWRPSWAVMSRGEAMVVSLRRKLPDVADEIMQRARRHYSALTENAVAV